MLCTLSHPRRVLCMAWAPGNRIVSGSEDGSLRLWDARVGWPCCSQAKPSQAKPSITMLPLLLLHRAPAQHPHHACTAACMHALLECA